MTAEVARPAAPHLDLRPAAPGGGGRFAAMFDAYAAHLFDYCYSLLESGQDAADATAASLVIAYSLIDRLKDPSRLRAWLFALARRECLDANPVRARLPRPTGDPALDEFDPLSAAPGLATLAEPQREVLDLVYRHGVSAAELPAVLGIAAADAKALLAKAAELAAAERVSADQGNADHSEADSLELPAAEPESWIAVLAAAGATAPETPGRADGARAIRLLPLLPLPPSIRRRAAHVALDPDLASYRESLGASLGEYGIDGFPLPPPPPPPPRRKLVLASGGLAAALLAPAAAGAVLFSMFGGPHALSHVLKGILDPGSSSQGTQLGGVSPPLPSSSLFPKKHEHQVLPILFQANPGASSHKPRPSPSQTSRIPASPTASPTSPSVSPSPTPTPTSPSPTPTPTGTP